MRDATLSSDSQAQPRPYFIVPVDPDKFGMSKISPLKHNLHEHPLMQLSSLASLAERLMPTKQCRFIERGMQQNSAFVHKDRSRDGEGVESVFRRIEEPGSWVALYSVQSDPLYRDFLNNITEQLRPFVEREQPGMYGMDGFIFISAPPSVTPFHIDRENNFWLQVHGRKVLNVWPHTDRVVVPGREVDRFIVTRSLDKVRLGDGFVPRSFELDAGPGDGAYFPATSPHMTRSDRRWTSAGNGVTVSIGMVFYTSVTRRHAYLHASNFLLRRLGLPVRSPGEGGALETLKYGLGRSLIWGMKKFKGYKPQTGM